MSVLKVGQGRLLAAVLIVLGGLMVGYTWAVMLTAVHDDAATGRELLFAGALICIGAGGVISLGLVFLLRGECWFFVDGSHFGFETRGFRKQSTRMHYRLDDFFDVDRDGGPPVIRLVNGARIPIPDRLAARVDYIEALLLYYRRISVVGWSDQSETGGSNWPWNFSNEFPRPAEPSPVPPARIDSPDALQSLIAQFRKSIIFREALPPAYALAKMFTEFKRTNGGLALFGVRPNGTMVGLPEEEVERAGARIKRLARELTEARVEVGRIELNDKVALFAVFNVIRSHTKPLEPYDAAISDVAVV